MSTRETSPEIASMAGRILASGNPFENEQVRIALHDVVAARRPDGTDWVALAIEPVLRPYIQNMLSLAGSCLSQAEPDDDENGQPRIMVTATVDWSKITNAIIGSFEGGSTDWLRQADYVYEPSDVTGNPAYAEDQFWAKGGQMRLHYDDPEDEDKCATKIVSLIEIKAGLRSMAEKDPRHFGNLVSETDDAITHDVFMQHVIFGEVIYG